MYKRMAWTLLACLTIALGAVLYFSPETLSGQSILFATKFFWPAMVGMYLVSVWSALAISPILREIGRGLAIDFPKVRSELRQSIIMGAAIVVGLYFAPRWGVPVEIITALNMIGLLFIAAMFVDTARAHSRAWNALQEMRQSA